MVKNFTPRTSKKERVQTEISSKIDRHILRLNDDKLLRGAQLMTLQLSKITVKEQVRTKFNEHSLQELAENIRVNGLIQPLVIHREGQKFVLLCGERRFRAMNMIGMEEAPCFILEGKNADELMAIQFSENSSREELHYIDKADGIYNYHKATGASERKIESELGISKTEVHRAILIAKLGANIKEAAKAYNIEKYVLVEFDEMESSMNKKVVEEEILKGHVTKRTHFKALKKALENGQYTEQVLVPKKTGKKATTSGKRITKKSLVSDQNHLL